MTALGPSLQLQYGSNKELQKYVIFEKEEKIFQNYLQKPILPGVWDSVITVNCNHVLKWLETLGFCAEGSWFKLLFR